MVGAASKGIIQRDHQHNAVVYKTYYAPNPFDNMSEEEIAKYKNDVERKARGESAGDWKIVWILYSYLLEDLVTNRLECIDMSAY